MCNCVKCLRNDFVSFYPSTIEINYLNLNLKLSFCPPNLDKQSASWFVSPGMYLTVK